MAKVTEELKIKLILDSDEFGEEINIIKVLIEKVNNLEDRLILLEKKNE